MTQNYAKQLLDEALLEKVSDIYIQPFQGEYTIFYRKNQERKLIAHLETQKAQALISHLKFSAGMNVGERRRVQLGSCWYALSNSSRRLRLSSVGDFDGRESLVIRILHEQKEKLDFWLNDTENLDEINFARGLYLFSGPVGSGKTSLMFDLARKHFAHQQVMTIEEPVEVVDADFIQLQVNEIIGNGYDELIKLSLRHRPDLLIVGEIRDKSTARAVLRASLTGTVVFSTVHAKSISGVWTRLIELGISEWELRNSLQMVVYQRLLAGKGLVDIAKGNFENWSTNSWNKKIKRLADNGFITADESEKEKIKSDQANQIDSTHEQLDF